MSSLTKTSAIVLKGEYNEESRKIPVLAYFERSHQLFDSGDYTGYEDLFTEEFSFRSNHGDHFSHDPGYHESHTFTKEGTRFFKDPLAEQKQFAEEIIVLEEQNGHVDMVWMGTFYADVKGDAASGEDKVKDPNGRRWDVAIPVAWHFDIVKDSTAKYGYKMAHAKMFKDMVKIHDLLDQRDHGHLKPTPK